MTIPTVQYPDNEEAAHAVYQHVQARPTTRHLRLQPASRGGGAYGEWWLIPGPERPPYRYGKLYIRRVALGPRMMSVGFCFHRGVGRHLDALVDPEVTMGPSWFWSRFLNDALAGAFETPLREIMARSGRSVQTTLELYHLNHAPGPRTGHPPDDRLVFTVDETTLRLRPDELAEEELAPLTTASDLRELALWVEGMQDLWWFWIDVHIGISLRYGDEETGDWGAADLWNKALAPWMSWVH
ncbi:MAG: hypothetical protein ACP5HS_04005 [Anaerolineae bacterium]